jgi:glycopeptide antibiotics resistance protein
LQLFYQRFNVQEYLLFTLLGITALVLIANFIGPDKGDVTTNWLSIILSSVVMFFSVIMVSKYGLKGNHGKAWILFMLFSAYWFCAETVGVLYEIVLGSEPWEYADDFFYITGYQLFFSSFVFYLRPFAKQISKKTVTITTFASLTLLIPSLFMIVNSGSWDSKSLILISYPILDSIILIPALIGIILFLKGGVNFMVSLLSLGIITQIIGDNSVLFLSLQDQYYSGHIVEVLFLWSYAMFAFGLYHQIRLFSEKPDQNTCPTCGKTCSGHK